MLEDQGGIKALFNTKAHATVELPRVAPLNGVSESTLEQLYKAPFKDAYLRRCCRGASQRSI